VAKNATSAPQTVRLIGDRRVSGPFGRSADECIHAIAARQNGRVSRGQLLAVGIKSDAIVRRLRNGRLEREHRGVYGLPGTANLPLASETAALLACGEGALLSHHSAVTLWALRPGLARPIHVTLIGDRGCPRLVGVTVHRSLTITSRDIRIHEGLPVTSPARTLLDVAPSLPDRDVERLVDEGVFARRIVTLGEIADVLARAGGHPGRARLARVAGSHRHTTQTDSPPEEKLLALIRTAGLPEPRTRFAVLDYRLDFFWPSLRLAVEVDAYGSHGSRARFEADRRRDARLLAERGIVVVRVTRLAIETRPFEVIALVARAIAQREAELVAA
jgi:very-short-patch-repair endonuclease